MQLQRVESGLIKYLPAAITAGIMILMVAGPAFAQQVDICPPGQFNPLCGFGADSNAFGRIVRFLVTILLVAAVVISLVFLIWGGIRWIISGGDKAGVESARNTIIAAIIGLVVAFVAFLVIQLVANFFHLGNIFQLTLPQL